jgi:hypothetical protein
MVIDIQFYCLLVLLVLSPFARYYREWCNQSPSVSVEETSLMKKSSKHH